MIWILAAISLLVSFAACISLVTYVFVRVKRGRKLIDELPHIVFGVPLSIAPVANSIIFVVFSCLIIYEIFGSKISDFLESVEKKIR